MAPSSPPALTAGVWPGQGTIRCHVVCGFCKQLQTQCSISCERPPRTAPERPTSETSAEVTAVVFTTEHLLLKAEFKTRHQLVPSTIAVESAAWVPRSSAGHLWERWPSGLQAAAGSLATHCSIHPPPAPIATSSGWEHLYLTTRRKSNHNMIQLLSALNSLSNREEGSALAS